VSVNILNRRIIMTPALASVFSPTSAQSAAFLARATNVTNTADKTNYDTLITGLVNDGVWAKLDALYIFATVDRTTALLNLVGTSFSPLTENGTVNFSAAHGYTGDGSTFYLDTGWTPSSGGSIFALNSAHLGAYNLTSDTVSGANVPIGSNDGSGNQSVIYLQPTFGHMTGYMNGSSGVLLSAGNAQGYWIDSANSTTLGMSQNGGAMTTIAATPGGLPTTKLLIFATTTTGGAPGNFLGDQLSAVHFGSYLTNTDIANLSNRINTYMTAYGINVY
jgi:hypothetical protein